MDLAMIARRISPSPVPGSLVTQPESRRTASIIRIRLAPDLTGIGIYSVIGGREQYRGGTEVGETCSPLPGSNAVLRARVRIIPVRRTATVFRPSTAILLLLSVSTWGSSTDSPVSNLLLYTQTALYGHPGALRRAI